MENVKVLKRRTKFLLSTAVANCCDTLTLDVFGRGTSPNDLAEVARTFAEEPQSNSRGCFKSVVFAIPKPSGLNYKTFEFAFREQDLLCKHQGSEIYTTYITDRILPIAITEGRYRKRC